MATDQDSRLSWNEHTRSSVKFAGEEEEAALSDDEVGRSFDFFLSLAFSIPMY